MEVSHIKWLTIELCVPLLLPNAGPELPRKSDRIGHGLMIVMDAKDS